MNLYEFQGREILNSFSIKVPDGIVASTPEESVQAAKKILENTKKKSLVIKAQIHAGGRGKSGGIQIAKSLKEVYEKSKSILGKYLITPQTSKKGKLVRKVLISEDVYSNSYIYDEYYISIFMNRDIEKNIIVFSKEGGMDIEEVYKNHPDKIYTEEIDPGLGIQFFQIKRIGFLFNLKGSYLNNKFRDFVISLYKAYLYYDALLLEINPLIKTLDNEMMAVDTKIVLDNNALFRHKKYYDEMRRQKKEDPIEIEAFEAKLNFLKLNGNVGCMVNGAGLAMATMDMIKCCGGNPANFLDIGGDADTNRVEKAFRIILNDKSVKAILINIFGGIVRCDTVAEGIINSYRKRNHEIDIKKIPIVIRLQGTNENTAKKMLQTSQLPIYSADSLEEAANKIKEILL
ncbi:ADP-forming succinate--CoA ligase subunit beta [Blattabacterium cuenoti]|uniref:ADP-forming succinate--CoA ligase subunit beta n=1 Tax=Blattabacterium cuenoti TaxID=1653831 RepID=UPI00163C681B|nr:ADP-forming succinate--CoA ligase subunit beta [Blattabacterium cuenoti]